MTIQSDGYTLWGTLKPGSCTPLAYTERFLENIMAHFKPAQLFTLGTKPYKLEKMVCTWASSRCGAELLEQTPKPMTWEHSQAPGGSRHLSE